MDDTTGASDPLEEWQRPIPEQVSVIRHDLAGIRQQFVLLNEVVNRIASRMESVEDRQTLMEAQVAALATTPEAVGAVVEQVLERRAVAAREERRRDLKEAFGKTRSVALYIIAVGQALMMLVGLWVFVIGRLL